jgi:hypothetical protein
MLETPWSGPKVPIFAARNKFSSSKELLCTLPNIAAPVPIRRDLVLIMINLEQSHSEEVLRIMEGRLFQLHTQEVCHEQA